MIRRTTQRSSAKNSSLPYVSSPSSPTKHSGKKKEKKTNPLQILFFALICLGSLGFLLTPSQKQELAQAEHKIEEWVQKEFDNSHPKNNPKPKKPHLDDKEPQKVVHHALADLHPEEHVEEAEEWQEEYLHPHQEAHDEANEAEKEAQAKANNKQSLPSSWVDGEKALKQKLKVLFDQQAKGENLAAPVLTRYLGESIPAFVGTPDSSMAEEEWKKLVEQKYKEMREEEEEWQKKMAAFIQSKDRDMGITTP